MSEIRERRTHAIVCAWLAVTLAAASASAAAQAWQSSASSVSSGAASAGSSSEAIFTGNDGRHIVDGDVVEIKAGRLSVNGLPYGRVKTQSVVRYSVQGKKKTLFVDGVERKSAK